MASPMEEQSNASLLAADAEAKTDKRANPVPDSGPETSKEVAEASSSTGKTQAVENRDTSQDMQQGESVPEFHHHAVEAGEPSAGSAFHVVTQSDSSKEHVPHESTSRDVDKSKAASHVSTLNIEGMDASDHSQEDSGKVVKHFSAHVVERSESQHASNQGAAIESQERQTESADVREENELLGTSADKPAVGDMNMEDLDEDAESALLAADDNDSNEVKLLPLPESKNADFQFDKPILESAIKDSPSMSSVVDNDLESELRKQHAMPVHKPAEVFDIDEETRMGLDQTPVDSSMIEASFIYPSLPPKKLFHLDDTKDSEASDTETKMSMLTSDTEDIRLRNTISIDDATKDSAASDSNMETPTPSRKQRRASREGLGISLMEGIEAGERVFTAENLFEYQWPQDGGDWHLLQEQISEYLKIKSFKRKYPDLYRRTCDKEEKDFLREKGVVTETQSDLGLTALRSEEVYDLMMKDYNEKYKEYISHLQEKQKKVIREKHKEYSAQAKLDKSKIESYSKKAAKSAAEFNASLMREKKDERKAYFDLQTYTIHFPKSKFHKLPAHCTKVGAYPVALISGQYQENFRRYTSEELKYYPMKTTLKDPPKMVKYVRPPPPGVKLPGADKQKATGGSDGEDHATSSGEEENEVEKENKEDTAENVEKDAEPTTDKAEPMEVTETPVKSEKKTKASSKKKTPKPSTVSPDRQKKSAKKNKEDAEKNDDNSQDGDDKGANIDGKKMPAKIHGLEKCRICKKRSTKEERKNDKLVKCAECGKIGHMGCLDLTEELVAVIKTYPWQCMECKTCVECLDPYDEDKMMFCDRCDRGYHTFCIGLDALPTGHWECKSCEGAPRIEPKPKPMKVTESDTATETPDTEVKAEPGVKTEAELAQENEGIQDVEMKPEEEKQDSDNKLETEGVVLVEGENDGDSVSDTIGTSDGVDSGKATASGKIEKRGRKRKNPDAPPKPPPPKQERIQGARQSRRLKLKEEEEEEKRKKEEEEKKLKKKKKKKQKKTEVGEGVGMKEESMDQGEDDVGNIYGEDIGTPSDDFREIVSEGVDESIVNMFDKNDDDEKDNEAADETPEDGNVGGSDEAKDTASASDNAVATGASNEETSGKDSETKSENNEPSQTSKNNVPTSTEKENAAPSTVTAAPADSTNTEPSTQPDVSKDSTSTAVSEPEASAPGGNMKLSSESNQEAPSSKDTSQKPSAGIQKPPVSSSEPPSSSSSSIQSQNLQQQPQIPSAPQNQTETTQPTQPSMPSHQPPQHQPPPPQQSPVTQPDPASVPLPPSPTSQSTPSTVAPSSSPSQPPASSFPSPSESNLPPPSASLPPAPPTSLPPLSMPQAPASQVPPPQPPSTVSHMASTQAPPPHSQSSTEKGHGIQAQNQYGNFPAHPQHYPIQAGAPMMPMGGGMNFPGADPSMRPGFGGPQFTPGHPGSYHQMPGPPGMPQPMQGPPGMTQPMPGPPGMPQSMQGPPGMPQPMPGPPGMPQQMTGPPGMPQQMTGPPGMTQQMPGAPGMTPPVPGPMGSPFPMSGPAGMGGPSAMHPHMTQGSGMAIPPVNPMGAGHPGFHPADTGAQRGNMPAYDSQMRTDAGMAPQGSGPYGMASDNRMVGGQFMNPAGGMYSEPGMREGQGMNTGGQNQDRGVTERGESGWTSQNGSQNNPHQ